MTFSFKSLGYTALLASALFAAPAFADDMGIPGEFSGSVTFTSEYAFRGIVQSDEHPALQGSIDYEHDSGFYAGVWGSSVDFNDGSQATVEMDPHAGFAGEIGNISWDIGAIYYMYPGANSGLDYDFFELALALGYDFDIFSLSGAVNYSPNFFADSGQSLYSAAYLGVPLPYDFAINAHVGHQQIDDERAFGADSYTDYAVGLGYNLAGFDLALDYVGTTLDEPGDIADNGEDRVIFSISKSFP
ncbi:MAG: TorF family putative porin [Alphaproteobacteria bacterium]|nr:TorF family putative porin [Alphaproteobacteria bacterium]MCD8570167.1 TorF family putative porin [Alphaproteobacteria bacterium]